MALARFKNILILMFSLATLSCSDYELFKVPDEPFPDIEALPESLDYGSVFAGVDVGQADVTVTNIGTDTLKIDTIALMGGDTTFMIQEGYEVSLEPMEATTVTVNYSPITYSSNLDKIRIYSNDPDEPFVDIEVTGSGDAPVIVIDPDYHAFASVYVGCNDYIPINVSNAGNVDLIINDLTHFSSLPADFEMYDYEPYYGMLPITIVPGDTITLEILYQPTDAFDDDGYVEINSNDPMNPTVYADQDGDGDYEKWVTDEFDQDETVDVDILFVIDNSGSMSSNQTNFKSNFSSFISVFATAGIDYHIAFITTDSEEFVDGVIITPADPDPISTVNTIVDNIGTRGSTQEAGLYYSYLSTSSGNPAGRGGAFLRDAAKLVVIYVSDEPDFSSYKDPSMSESDYVNHLRSLKSSSNLIAAHAVAGDYPSGCTSNGGAQFGDGYYDVVTSLGGSFLSICAADWGSSMDTLARESVVTSTFVLTEKAIDGTIGIQVDGVTSFDWYFDEAINAVQFNAAPPEGSKIEITYAVWSCEES